MLEAMLSVLHDLFEFRKRELIPREELVVQWRPLHKLLEAVVYSPYEHLGLVLFPS